MLLNQCLYRKEENKMKDESYIMKLRLEADYIGFQIFQKKATYEDHKRLNKINRILEKLSK
jgi:hypothetical protein